MAGCSLGPCDVSALSCIGADAATKDPPGLAPGSE